LNGLTDAKLRTIPAGTVAWQLKCSRKRAGDTPLAETRLSFVLSIVAGCMDVISFLALGGVFTAH
jgi:hypothetical protein